MSDQTGKTPRSHRAARRVQPSPANQVALSGTVGSTKPDLALALLRGWAEEGDAAEDRRAYEALTEEIERLRS